jgi:hypothetical protein
MSETPEPHNNAPAPTTSFATTSLIMGVLGWTLIPIVGGIIAIITGHMAKRDIRQSDGILGGEGIATAGLILGYSNLALGACACLALLLFPTLLAGIWAFGNNIIHTVP